MRVAGILTVVGLLAMTAPAFADDAPPPPMITVQVPPSVKLELARRLLKDNGAADALMTTIDGGIDEGIIQQKKTHPEIPDAFWTEFKVEFHDYIAGHTNDFIDVIAGLYAERLSEDELQQAVAFYETGAGKKLIDPELVAELKRRASVWGEKAGEQIGAQVVAKMKGTGQQ